jgi:hypothetical protein
MSTGNAIADMLAKREAMKQRLREGLENRQVLVPNNQVLVPNNQVLVPNNPQVMTPLSKKAGWGWAFLIVGGGIFIFWGIPLMQGKGKLQPGMSKTPGYVPTRSSPGE